MTRPVCVYKYISKLLIHMNKNNLSGKKLHVVDKILIDLHKMSFDAGAECVVEPVFTGNMAQR